MLEIRRGVSIVDPWPALCVEELGLLVMADLHLGFEESLRKEGFFLPAGTSRRASDSAREATIASGARRVVLLGDIKHEFGYPNPSEWVEVKALLHWFVRRGVEVEVVRGNHDNYVVAILRKFGISLSERTVTHGGNTFTHGHLQLDESEIGSVLFLGHEHPSVALEDERGFVHRFKCFLHGRCGGREVFVLPSAMELATGTVVNRLERKELLSPILRSCGVEDFKPYLLEPGKELRSFPSISFLRATQTKSPVGLGTGSES